MTPEQRLARVDEIIAEIKASMERPGCRTLNSIELKHRADYRRQLATQIKLGGGRVKPEYK